MADTSASSSCTRSQDNVWLVGHPIQSITGKRLPSIQQVLACFFYHHKVQKETVRESATIVAREIKTFWDMARIPTTQQRNIIPRIENLFASWKNLQKRAKSRTSTQIQKEASFTEQLDSLFDIAHASAMELITIEEDKQFIIAQRNGRRGYMGVVDKELAAEEDRKLKRIHVANERKRKEDKRRIEAEAVASSVSLPSSGDEGEVDNTDSSVTSDEDTDTEEPKQKASHKKARSVVSPELAAVLDRTKVSDRNAAFLIAATASSLGHNVSSLAVNRSSIRKSRIRHRAEMSAGVKLDYETVPDVPLVIHWDGKILPDITGKQETVDRLPIYVSGAGKNKLLCVPKLPDGTGKAVAAAVKSAVDEWKLADRIQAACFDTTASNTGQHSGACHLLEQDLGKSLLYLPCRHHIHEIIIGHVFDVCHGCSSGPDVQLFARFKKHWSLIDKQQYEVGHDDEETKHILSGCQETVDEVKSFAKQVLQSVLPRDDYRECLELVLIFLGETPDRGVHFLQPGAHHRARWMAKMIYSLKMWMFKRQFKMTTREVKGLRDLNIFVALVYTKAWFRATNAVTAPSNDLDLIKALLKYQQVNATVSSAAMKKLFNHFWYLSDEAVALSFFASDVSSKSKRDMVAALSKPGSSNTSKRAKLQKQDIEGSQLADFVNGSTLHFFERFNIDKSFLQKDPDEWQHDADYSRAKEFLTHLTVVNDLAERGVALMEQYNSILTKDEEQKQFLLQVIEEHRRRFPDSTKRTLMAGLQQSH